jgi:hypothetical protein
MFRVMNVGRSVTSLEVNLSVGNSLWWQVEFEAVKVDAAWSSEEGHHLVSP